MKTKFIYSSLFFIATGIFSANAQDKKTTDKKDDKKTENQTINEEIEVVRPYKPILAEAVKLRRSPDLNDIKTYKAKLNYNITDRKLELNSDIKKLQAQQIAAEKQNDLVNNYIKAGVGNLNTLLGEAYINIGKDEALQSGAFFRHLSQEGKLLGQKSTSQQLSVFGKSIGDVVNLSGKLNYERNGLYFYGYDDAHPALNPNPEKQVFNFFEADGEIANRFSEDENATSYALKVNGYLWGDKFDAKENNLTLNGYLNKRINSFNLGLAVGTEFGSTKNATLSISNNILRLNPYIRLQAKGVKITAGINYIQEFGSFSAGRLFPAVTADFTLIPDYLQVFGELKGDVNRNSMKQFTDENPFLNSNIEIKNTVEKLSITAGIKGTGGPGFGYKAKIYSKQLTNMPLYTNNFTNFNKFDVIYDFGTMNLLGLEGELAVQVSDDLKWTGKLNMEEYSPSSESYSWFKPQLRVSSNLNYNINNKIGLNASLVLQDDSRAKVYTAAPASPYVLPNRSIENIVNVKGFVDLGFGATYRINNKFSAFANANNLLNTKYSQYLYYPHNGLNLFGGITYSF